MRSWSCPGGSLPITCGSGVSKKVLVSTVMRDSPGGRDPNPRLRAGGRGSRARGEMKCESTRVVVFVPGKVVRSGII